MIEENNSVQKMWEDYLKSIGENVNNSTKKYTSWHFCDNEKDANELANLVKEEIKKATASLYYWYELGEETEPKVGDLSIITDWNGIAQCIIETSKINIVPFKEVTEEFARLEGEGDKTLKHWSNVHMNYFSRELQGQEKEFSEDMLVLCEEFKLVYK
ncbi:hypothetical protein CLPU_3c02360 [Gottschalkia purinilytica]|uniref:ASCH domain-containing protein n=1 Tax=Gottschalkia purinilytica TaxID=1503 RepID=A0A0L0WDC3_GOTPU|nr:ASCH domain-containing protein [Gottschalkia purinilytica]KNF09457.1 hypothetical protein CLPU_3c02360 [Gottschalkia purinilytica]